LRVSAEQGGARQMPEIHVVRGETTEPEAPTTESKPMIFEQLPKSLVNRPPAAAWQPGERFAAKLRANMDPSAAKLPDEELLSGEEPA